VLARAVRLIEHNQERFAKTIRPGPLATGQLVLAPEPGDDEIRVRRLFAHWSDRSGSHAMLARTNRELLPAAAVALAEDRPFQAAGLRLLVEDDRLPDLLEAVRTQTDPGAPLLVRLGWLRDHTATIDRATEPGVGDPDPGTADPDPRRSDSDADAEPSPAEDTPSPADLASALLGWAVRYPDLDTFEAAIRTARVRLAALRRSGAPLTLATAHATKGLEFDHVAVLGMDDGRFPSARALADADDPVRALEEERRLAYVAWTRARSSLTLVFDPGAPSTFLLEAFDANELGLDGRGP
jgi:superfamily I DNA/RNA helicase